MGKNYKPREEMERKDEQLLCSYTVYGVWDDSVDNSEQSDQRDIQGVSELFTEEGAAKMARQKIDGSQATMRKPKGPSIQKLWSKGDKVRLSKHNGSRTFFNPGIRNSGQTNGDRQDRQQWKLCSGECAVCYSEGKPRKQKKNSPIQVRSEILAIQLSSSNTETFTGADKGRNYSRCEDCRVRKKEELEGHQGKVRVYDIRNAGRHHRFTVSGKLVHNCGYQGSSGALISMGALDMGLKESELPDIVEGWRQANPHVVQYWWDVQDAAIKTVQDHKDRAVGKIEFHYYANTLWFVLPSGRRLAFLNPKIQPNRFGSMALTFMGTGGVDSGGKWGRQETYGGKEVENITQAIARDLLVDAMVRMEKMGLNIVAHVHDEVIIESPIGEHTVEEVCGIMSQNPEWADGLPLAAAGYSGQWYYKD